MVQQRSQQKQTLLGATGVAVLRAYLAFTLRTTRWTVSISPEAMPFLIGQDGKTALVAFWHEILPLSPALWWWAEPQNPKLRLSVLISRNSDGRMIADIVAPWRIWSIAGSSDNKGKSKGGASAFRRMRALLNRGQIVAITPDGPRGPRRVVQQGAVSLAGLTGLPVVPIGASCSGIRVKTWDRMLLPLPFGKGHLVCGSPLTLVRHAAGEAARLESALNEQMTQAEQNTQRSAAYQDTKGFLLPLDIMPSRLWYGLATLLAPVLPFLLRWRQKRGKELPTRVREKMGFASLRRPQGKLLWFHAASVGEVLSLLPLVENCLAHCPACCVLLTTGTVTAAALVKERVQQSVFAAKIGHQFLPFDVPRWGVRFLNHWRPDAVVFTESDLWPNLIGLCHKRAIPLALVNGRMSDHSFKAWQKIPKVAQRMLERFAWIAPRSDHDAAHFVQLSGGCSVGPVGDIKTLAQPLPVDWGQLAVAQDKIGERPVFLAASTHDGEEAELVEAVALLRRRHPTLLTVIVPRHPERGAALSALFECAPRRSCGQWPNAQDPVWVCDTLGELGLFYRLAQCAFIGNSLQTAQTSGGGHNPFEPARLKCPVATGPRTQNFSQAFEQLGAGIVKVNTAQQLAAWVSDMLSKPEKAEQQAECAYQKLEQQSELLETLTQKIVALLVA